MERKKKPKKRKTSPRCDSLLDLENLNMEGLDLATFFFYAIRARSLYPLLDGLQAGCLEWVRQIHLRLVNVKHPTVRILYEEEVEFFEAAAEQIGDISILLDHQWQERAPAAAHGDARRADLRISQVASEYMNRLAAKLTDPSNSDEERRCAGIALAEEGRETLWIDPKTGHPSFEIPRLFADAAVALKNLETPEVEQREAIEMIQRLASL
jgi:hypothetical protein